MPKMSNINEFEFGSYDCSAIVLYSYVVTLMCHTQGLQMHYLPPSSCITYDLRKKMPQNITSNILLYFDNI